MGIHPRVACWALGIAAAVFPLPRLAPAAPIVDDTPWRPAPTAWTNAIPELEQGPAGPSVPRAPETRRAPAAPDPSLSGEIHPRFDDWVDRFVAALADLDWFGAAEWIRLNLPTAPKP